MKKMILVGSIALMFLAGFGYIYHGQASKKMAATIPGSAEMVFGGTRLRLDIVSKDADRQKGLGGRPSLPSNLGMLFLFPVPDRYDFWMKDMHFPIDILWIRQGTVVDLVTLRPPQAGQEPARHLPIAPADRVLEVQAGLSARMGIGIGSQLVLPEL